MTKALADHLEAVLRRKVPREELALALQVSNATLSRRKRDGFSAEDIIMASRYFGLSPVQSLVACGLIHQVEVDAAAQGVTLEGFSDLDIAEEMVRRIAAGTASRLSEDPLDSRHPAMVRGMHPRMSQGDYMLGARDDDDDLEAEAQQEEP